MLQPATVQFLQELKNNNQKPWFDENRSRYETAKKDFQQFIQAIIIQFSQVDSTLAALQPKDCIFRINRDIRFSKDKTPYKTNFGASINRGGKKSVFSGYYFHLEPGGESFVGGGLWMPLAPDLKKVRQEIDYSFEEFSKIIRHKTFTTQYGELVKGEYSLTTVPKGYEKDNPAIEYLKLKSYVVLNQLNDKELTSKDLLKKTTNAFAALQPLVSFINRALEHENE